VSQESPLLRHVACKSMFDQGKWSCQRRQSARISTEQRVLNFITIFLHRAKVGLFDTFAFNSCQNSNVHYETLQGAQGYEKLLCIWFCFVWRFADINSESSQQWRRASRHGHDFLPRRQQLDFVCKYAPCH